MAGFGDFLNGDYQGITYGDTYFIQKSEQTNDKLHFHELIHVAQWQLLGVRGFLVRYMEEIGRYGYENSPLEVMARHYENRYGKRLPVPDLLQSIYRDLQMVS